MGGMYARTQIAPLPVVGAKLVQLDKRVNGTNQITAEET